MSAERLVALLVGAAAAVLAAAGLMTALEGPDTAEDAAVPASRTKAIVVDVVDGDTLRVPTPGGRDLGRVRLLGVDAPEVADYPDPAECYGDTATHILAGLTPIGSTVWLATDPTQDSRDVYGRLLRYVDHHGDDVSRQLLEAGAARSYDSTPAITRAGDYAAAAAAAQPAGRGLWGVC